MRALCAVVVACVVAVGAAGGAAAAGGPGRGEPCSPAGLALAGAVPSSLSVVVLHPALHAVTARPARTRGRASPPSLAAVLAAGWSLHRPGHAVVALRSLAGARRGEPPVRTGSARGPPIG